MGVLEPERGLPVARHVGPTLERVEIETRFDGSLAYRFAPGVPATDGQGK